MKVVALDDGAESCGMKMCDDERHGSASERTSSLIRTLRDLAVGLERVGELAEACEKAVAAISLIQGVSVGWLDITGEETGSLRLVARDGMVTCDVPLGPHTDNESRNANTSCGEGPLFSSEADPLPELEHIHRRESVGCIACFPVRERGRVVGSLGAGFSSGEPAPGAIRQVLEAIASQLSCVVDRLRTEEALRISELHVGTGEDAQAELVCRFLPDGTLLSVNNSFCQYLGSSRENLLGTSFFGSVPDADRKIAMQSLASLDSTNQVATCEHRLVALHGELRWLQWRQSATFDEHEEAAAYQCVGQDITERVKMDRMKTDFVTTVAHTLRTPLTSILGFAELLLAKDDLSHDEKKRYLGYIRNRAGNMADVVNDLLDISRIESGAGPSATPQPCNVAEIVGRIASFYQERSPKHRFETVLPQSPLTVAADEFSLTRLFQNLLDNAVKYSPDGGLIRLTCRPHADYYMFSVEDQGEGMNPGQIQKVFDAFYRADSSDTSVTGTGLGMTIAKNIVENLGGKISVESEYGNGTTVRFTIPIQESNPGEQVGR